MLEYFKKNLKITSENRNLFFLIFFGVVFLLAMVAFVSPVKTLGLLVVALFLILGILKPEIVVVFLALYIPFEPFLLKFIPDEIYVYARYFSEVLIYLLLFSAGLKLLTKEKKFFQTPVDISFYIFIIILIVSWIINFTEPAVAVLGIRQITRFILLYYAVCYLDLKKDLIKNIVFSMFLITAAQSIIGIFQAIIGGPLDEFLIPAERKLLGEIQLTTGTEQFWGEGQRIFATMGRYDQLGTFLCFFSLLACGFLYQVKDARFKLYLYLMLALSIPALVLTMSRASWFGFVLGFVLISTVLKRDKRFIYIFLAGLAVMIGYAIYNGIVVRYLVEFPTQSALERFFEAFSYERWRGEYYGLGRLYFIVNTLLLVVPAFPLFGAGAGQYGGGAVAALHNTEVYDKLGIPFGVYGTQGYIDNNWLSLLGETGILGFMAYISIFIILFILSLKIYLKSKSKFSQGLALGFMGTILALSFQAFLGTYLEVRTIAVYFWLFAAFMVTIYQREKLNFFN